MSHHASYSQIPCSDSKEHLEQSLQFLVLTVYVLYILIGRTYFGLSRLKVTESYIFLCLHNLIVPYRIFTSIADEVGIRSGSFVWLFCLDNFGARGVADMLSSS